MNRNLIVIIGLGVWGAHASEDKPKSLLTEALKKPKLEQKEQPAAGLKRVDTRRSLAVPEQKPSALKQELHKDTLIYNHDIWAQRLEEETAKIEAFSLIKAREKLAEAGIDVPNGPIRDVQKESEAMHRYNGFCDELHLARHRNKDGFGLRWKLLQKLFQKVLLVDTVKQKTMVENLGAPVVQFGSLSGEDGEEREDGYETGEDEFDFPV